MGPGWALLGDAAGHMHPLTGESIAYALWSAELLAQAFVEGAPFAYEELWRAQYGHRQGSGSSEASFRTPQELVSASQALQFSTTVSVGAYKMLFHARLMAAMQGVGL